MTASEVKRCIDEGFLAGLAEPQLRALAVWDGSPYPDDVYAARCWRAGYEAGHVLRAMADHQARWIPDPGTAPGLGPR